MFQNLLQGLVDRGGLERRPAGEQFVEKSTQPIDVDRGCNLAGMTRDLLGGHVGGGAEDEAGVGQTAVVLDALGEPEIGDVRVVLFVEQDVRGFQVAVQDAAPVCIVDRQSDLLHQPCDGSRVVFEPRAVPFEIATGEKLEADEREAAILAHLVDRHDMGMVERRDRSGLDPEPVDRVGIRHESGGPDRLQGHDAAEFLVPGFEDDAHPAGSDLLDQRVLAEIRACGHLVIRACALARVVCWLVTALFWRGQKRAGHALESIFVGEERNKVGSEFVMASQNIGTLEGRPAWAASRYSAMASSSLCSRSATEGSD